MVLGIIIKMGALVAGLVTFGLFVSRASQVGIGNAGQEISDAVGSFGQGIGEIGTGLETFGVGAGRGISGLFAPFQWLFNLGTQPASMPVLNANISASSGVGQAGARASRGGGTTSYGVSSNSALGRAIDDIKRRFPIKSNPALYPPLSKKKAL